MLDTASEDYFYEVKHFPLFQQIYNVGTHCMKKIRKSEDCSGDTFIRIEVVGKFNKDNMNLISEGKGELTKRKLLRFWYIVCKSLTIFLLYM